MSDFENKSKMNTSCTYMKEEKLLGRNHYQCQMSRNVKSLKEYTCAHTHMHICVHKYTLLAKILLEIFKH